MPIVMGRVYDSALTEGSDFGPGWKLTVVEEVRREGTRLLFTDASNATYSLDVEGDVVTPTSPQTAPVVSGSTRTTGDGVGIVVLESADGMIRRFKQDGDVWRLVHVRHGRGWVRLEWRRGVLTEVTSDRGWVRIARRGDGRVTSIRDDLGRTVGYSYDAGGRLSGLTDRAGESWRMGYVNGRLSSITDPRTKVVLAVDWTEERVRRIRVLHETTDFRYAGNSTTATNLLGWSTAYRRSSSGITESITDRMGATTEIAFDADHRPATVTRDGSTIARIGYDDEGRLATLWRPGGETTFTNSRRGVTVANGAWSARYRYSDRRVEYARDAGGERSYQYAADGSLAGVTVDGIETELRTDTDGTLREASRAGKSLISYVYAPDGRVSSIAYGNGGTAEFIYDARGLRTAADYAYGDSATIEATMAYDAAGNLTHIEHSRAEEASVQNYTIGDYNEVLGVLAADGRGPDRQALNFGYDATGRLVSAAVGGRSATVEYDALDRGTRVVVDGGTVLEEAYGPEDDDSAAREDKRTGGVLVAAPVSPVFGTMESIVYTRPRTAEFGVVAYSPSRKTFEVRLDALAADAVLLAALESRMAPVRGEDPNPAPLGHDKPSNSLFVPPEFRSVNCVLCTAAVFDVYLTVTPAPVYCATAYTAVVDGFCQQVVNGPEHVPIGFGIPLPWLHATDYGDGTSSGTLVTTSTQIDGSHAYYEADTYTMTHSALCSCPSAFAFASASRTFGVPGGNLCEPVCGAHPNNPPRVTIQSASIPDNRIAVTLVGLGCSGNLEVRVTGSRTHTVATIPQAMPGSHTIDFGRDVIPEGQYERVEATWRIRDGLTPDGDLSYRFSALGTYTHSQYNKPSQTHPTCNSGSQTNVFITEESAGGTTNCFDDEDDYTATTFPEKFRFEVEENGSGKSTDYGAIQLDWVCPYKNTRPDGATFGRVFRDVNTILPACTGGTLGNSTVAVDPHNAELTCGDTIFVSGVGTKTVTDHCPICGPTKIDHYTSDGRCTGIVHLGTRRTFRLNR